MSGTDSDDDYDEDDVGDGNEPSTTGRPSLLADMDDEGMAPDDWFAEPDVARQTKSDVHQTPDGPVADNQPMAPAVPQLSGSQVGAAPTATEEQSKRKRG